MKYIFNLVKDKERVCVVVFILLLKYLKPLEEVDKALEEHKAYLEKYYQSKKFFCSGRRNPRVGGVILCNATDINEVNQIIKDDPFYVQKIAEYEIVHFIPTKYSAEFKSFIEDSFSGKKRCI